MTKRNILFACAGLAIIVIAGSVYAATRPPAMTPSTYTKAKQTPATGSCLAENTSLNIPASDRSNIELIAISHLIDVPAGTNVDVKFATYTDQKITGSDRYPEKYGSYNFAMEKRRGEWAITEFKRCS